jgi:hypothetical protein
VTRPLDDTVATPLLVVDHVKALSVALDGVILAVSCNVLPIFKNELCSVKSTDVTAIVADALATGVLEFTADALDVAGTELAAGAELSPLEEDAEVILSLEFD